MLDPRRVDERQAEEQSTADVIDEGQSSCHRLARHDIRVLFSVSVLKGVVLSVVIPEAVRRYESLAVSDARGEAETHRPPEVRMR